MQNCQNHFFGPTLLQIVQFTTRKDQTVPRQSYYILVKVKGQAQGCENAKVIFQW